MTDLYSLRGRALEKCLRQLVIDAFIAGGNQPNVAPSDYADVNVPDVPTRRRTRQWLGSSDGLSTPLYELSWYGHDGIGHTYKLVASNGGLTFRTMLEFLEDERLVAAGREEEFAALCIDLSTNPDEDIE